VALYLLMRSNHRAPLAIGGERLALTEVADELSRLSLRPLASLPGPRPAAFAVPPEADDLRAVFGWAPRTTVRDGLAELYAELAESDAGHD
jgi:nucleoside-diphosphate-sugar epimerase